MPDVPPIIISDDASETDELGSFLEKVSCAPLFVYTWPKAIHTARARIALREDPFAHYPVFSRYIKEILDHINSDGRPDSDFIYPDENAIKLEISKRSPIDTLQEATRERMRGQGWDLAAVWRWVGAGLAFGCAAGGSKALLDLLKLWVEERKGRRIKIKKRRR